MALDLAAHRIRVNAIAPGPTLTGLTAPAMPIRRGGAHDRADPLGRLGDPQDLVGASCFLPRTTRLGDRSTVTVDGGYNAM